MLAEIEAYYDAAPRLAARVEELPPFVLFVKQENGWPYYARPQLGASRFTVADVVRVLDRQSELDIPQAFEWVQETTPGLRTVALDAALAVTMHPLMLAADSAAAPPMLSPGVSIRRATPEDDLVRFGAIANVGFSFPGTSRGDAGEEAVADEMAKSRPESTEFVRQRLAAGHTVMAVAFLDGTPVAVGSHQPVHGVTEVVGVATLPAFRRRGIGAAITAFLMHDARERGVRTVFLSAGDDEIARVYERVGFHRIGTACVAEP